MKNILLSLVALLSFSNTSFAQNGELAKAFKAGLEASNKKLDKEFDNRPPRPFINGTTYTDSAFCIQFYFTPEAVIENKSGEGVFKAFVSFTNFLESIEMVKVPVGFSTERYAKEHHKEHKQAPNAGASNFKQSKVKHDKENFAYGYTQSWTDAKGNKLKSVIQFKQLYKHYSIAKLVTIYKDDENATASEATIDKIYKSITEIDGKTYRTIN